MSLSKLILSFYFVWISSQFAQLVQIGPKDNIEQDLFTVQLIYIYLTINYSFFAQNAMRAVVEQHGSSVDIPPLKILITKGRQDLTVKVCNWCVSCLSHSTCSNEGSLILATSLRFIWRCTPNTRTSLGIHVSIFWVILLLMVFVFIFLITQTCF